MQKHFAIITGIAMLAIAGVVVLQRTVDLHDSIAGSITPFYPPMSSSSSSPPGFIFAGCNGATPQCGIAPANFGGTATDSECVTKNAGRCSSPSSSPGRPAGGTTGGTSGGGAPHTSSSVGYASCPNACGNGVTSGCCNVTTNICQ